MPRKNAFADKKTRQANTHPQASQQKNFFANETRCGHSLSERLPSMQLCARLPAASAQTISTLPAEHKEPPAVAHLAMSVPLLASQHTLASWHICRLASMAAHAAAKSAQLPEGSAGSMTQS